MVARGSKGVVGEAYGKLGTGRRVKQGVKWKIDKGKRGLQSCINIMLGCRVGKVLRGVSTLHWIVFSSHRGISYGEEE